jgi:hypothetical protein
MIIARNSGLVGFLSAGCQQHPVTIALNTRMRKSWAAQMLQTLNASVL